MSAQTCTVVMYHYVRDTAATAFRGIRAMAPPLFEQQLDWLQSRYAVISVSQLEAALDGAAPLPPAAALLTFDDGFVDHYEAVLPALHRRGLSGVFFLTQDACGDRPRLLGVHKVHFLLAALGAERFRRSVLDECTLSEAGRGAVRTVYGHDRWDDTGEQAMKQLLNYELPFAESERILERLFARHIGSSSEFARSLYLSLAMVREMAGAGMAFGYHTRSHQMLSRLDAREQRDQVNAGVAWIRGLTGQRSVTFCYPWGGPQTYTPETVRLLGESGYSLAFNTVRRRAAIGADGRFELPRIDTRDLPPYTAGETGSAASVVHHG